MLAEISVSNPKRTALKHPLINIIMAKKASPSAAVTKVAMRVQIKVCATTIQASDVKAVPAGVEPSDAVGLLGLLLFDVIGVSNDETLMGTSLEVLSLAT